VGPGVAPATVSGAFPGGHSKGGALHRHGWRVYRRVMRERPLQLAALVLAAGAGSRFSAEPGRKLLAPLEGRPLLAHVLATLREAMPATTIVVLGHGAPAVERAIDWAGEVRVRNPAPALGLASSLQLGIHALEARDEPIDGAFIVLGDQPRLRADVLHALEHAAAIQRPADRPLLVPRYLEDPGPRNPVLLLRPAWPIVDGLQGDRGLGALIDARPDLVLEVETPGSMPDVDRPEDLERL